MTILRVLCAILTTSSLPASSQEVGAGLQLSLRLPHQTVGELESLGFALGVRNTSSESVAVPARWLVSPRCEVRRVEMENEVVRRLPWIPFETVSRSTTLGKRKVAIAPRKSVEVCSSIFSTTSTLNDAGESVPIRWEANLTYEVRFCLKADCGVVSSNIVRFTVSEYEDADRRVADHFEQARLADPAFLSREPYQLDRILLTRKLKPNEYFASAQWVWRHGQGSRFRGWAGAALARHYIFGPRRLQDKLMAGEILRELRSSKDPQLLQCVAALDRAFAVRAHH